MIVPRKSKWTGSLVPGWLLNKAKISSNAKLIYGQLCQLSTDYGVTFVTLDVLANACGLTVRAISRGMHELEGEGLIDKRRIGMNQSNQYRFPHHQWMDESTDPSGIIKISDYKEAHDVSDKRGQRLPADFQLSSDTRKFAIELVGEETTNSELEQFKDYWWSKGGQSAIKINWQLAFKNWIRNHIKFSKGKSSGFKRGGDARQERQSAIAAALDKRLESGQS